MTCVRVQALPGVQLANIVMVNPITIAWISFYEPFNCKYKGEYDLKAHKLERGPDSVSHGSVISISRSTTPAKSISGFSSSKTLGEPGLIQTSASIIAI